MKILVLGGTGRVGKEFIRVALQKGHTLHAVVRNPKDLDTLKNPDLRLFKGMPTDTMVVENALQGCQAVVSLLNISRKTDFPWSKLLSPHTLMSDSMELLTEICPPNFRIVICTANGVGDTRKYLPKWFQWLIEHSNLGYAYLDHERQEKIIKQSQMAWTFIRPTMHTNKDKGKQLIESYNNQPPPNLYINRKDVARFMMQALFRNDLIGKAPVISN